MKQFTALIFTAIFAFALTACGKNDSGSFSRGGYEMTADFEIPRNENANGSPNNDDGNGNDDSPSSNDNGGGDNNPWYVDAGNVLSVSASDNPPPEDLDVTPVSDFNYKYDADLGGVVITRYMGSSLRIGIPETIDGYPVTGIGNYAFIDSGLTYVYIPDGVTGIGAGAFEGCKNLSEITIPAGVVGFNTGIFAGCGNISITRLGILSDSYALAKIGSIIKFGGFYWQVLDIQNGKALLITESLIERRPYHNQFKVITWESCDLRRYLNGEFFDSAFTAEEKKLIAETDVINSDNPGDGTPGGNDTTDKIFLLSIDEAQRYFANDEARRAYENGMRHASSALQWWLRSPGFGPVYAACVLQGNIHITGSDVNYKGNAVRPALWINL